MPRRVWLVTVMVVGFIVYGSLYPFEFRIPPHGPGAVTVFLASWNARPGRGDFIANVLLYMPLGFFFAPGFRRGAIFPRVLLAVLAGGSLSLCIELTQYYDAGRDTEATDFYANTLGTLLGSLAALVLGARLRPSLTGNFPIPVLLIVAWLGYRLYPYVPTINLHKYIAAIAPVFRHPSFTAYDLFRQSAIWLALLTLLSDAVRGRLTVVLFVPAVFCAKVLIIGTELRAAELLGAGIAFAVWFAARRFQPRIRAGIAGGVLCLYVTALRLEPFHFQATAGAFGWLPFRGFMNGSVVVDTLSFLEKFFLYGSLLYLLGSASGRRAPVVAFVAALLLVTSWMQTFLPGRSAEITDTMMVLAIALVFAVIRPDDEGGRQQGACPVTSLTPPASGVVPTQKS
jgi:VanZ family protein